MIATDGKCGICGMVMSPEGLTFHSCGGVPTLVAPQPPPDGPGSHAWDFREMQIQRERADKAEAHAEAAEAKLAEVTRSLDELRARTAGWGYLEDDAERVRTLEAKLADIHDALHAECDGTADLPAEIRTLRAKLAEAERERDDVLLIRLPAAESREKALAKALERIERDSEDELSRECARAALAGGRETDHG